MGAFRKGAAGKRGHNPQGVVIHNDAGSGSANAAFYRGWLPHHEANLGFAHYYVGNDGVFQAEDEANMAWHTANSYGNRELIGIEACQSMGNLAQFLKNEQESFKLAAQILKRYGLQPNRNTVRLHKELSSTACPHRSWEQHGKSVNDVKDYFISQIKKYMGGSAPAHKPKPKPQPSKKTVKVKKSAWAWSKSVGGKRIPSWVKGGTFELAEKRNYKQDKSTAEYVIKNKGVVIGAVLAQDIEGATEVVKSTPKPQSSGIKWYAERGTFTANDTINVRDKPSTSGKVVAQYKKGQSVIYDKFCHNGGYVWLSYIANSGARRYMVAGRSNGKKRTSSFGTFR